MPAVPGKGASLRLRHVAVDRLRRYDLLFLAAVFVFILDAGHWLAYVRSGQFAPLGADFTVYQHATQSWLAGGPFYRPYQVTGPYPVVGYTDLSLDPILYPPPILALFVPMMAIPFLWWAIPLAAISYVVWRNRTPSRLLLVTALALWPHTAFLVAYGNPTLWLVAFLALAVITPLFAPLLLLKPTLWPFALFRIRDRRWWLGLALFAVASLSFASMWPDYVTVVLNATDHAGLLHSLGNVPALMIPLLVSRSPSRGREADARDVVRSQPSGSAPPPRQSILSSDLARGPLRDTAARRQHRPARRREGRTVDRT